VTRLAQDCYHGSEVPQLTEPSKNHLQVVFSFLKILVSNIIVNARVDAYHFLQGFTSLHQKTKLLASLFLT
jgi:hypothetical protein